MDISHAHRIWSESARPTLTPDAAGFRGVDQRRDEAVGLATTGGLVRGTGRGTRSRHLLMVFVK